MYYLISGPCQLCSAACGGIATLFKESCKCCNGICAGLKSCWSDTFGDVYHKPVGGFVIFTWLIMLLAFAVGVVGFAELKCEDGALNNAKNILLVCIVFAVLHALCVYYIQRKTLKNISDTIDKEEDEKGPEGVPKDQRDYDISADYRGRVRKAIWEVIKYDFLFLFYFFFCPAAFCVGCYGLSLLDKCLDKDAKFPAGAFWILVLYNAAGGLYFAWLMCGIACGAGASKVKTTVKKAKKGAKSGP
jgi:hypothetical protein